MDDLQLLCVPKTDVAKIWHGPVHDLIDSGFAAVDVPMPDGLLEEIEIGTRLLWVVVTPQARIISAMLTQLFEMRSGRVCKMVVCGGAELSSWVTMRAEIEQYAKREGCSRVLAEGRPGWAVVLEDYKTVGVTLEKRI